MQIIINVLDKNDNAPIFLQNKYEVRLLENKMDFETSLVVEATDMDQNGKTCFTYPQDHKENYWLEAKNYAKKSTADWSGLKFSCLIHGLRWKFSFVNPCIIL